MLTIVVAGIAIGLLVAVIFFFWLLMQCIVFNHQEQCVHKNLRYKDWSPEQKWQCSDCGKLM